jgi:hypothetical protein
MAREGCDPSLADHRSHSKRAGKESVMPEVTDREMLAELVARPIGGKHIQGEDARGLETLYSAEAKEAAARANKRWLPAGKRSTRGPDEAASREAFYARQIDLEDAVEAAGGQRGGRAS